MAKNMLTFGDKMLICRVYCIHHIFIDMYTFVATWNLIFLFNLLSPEI